MDAFNIAVLVIILSIVFILYKRATKNFGFFKKQGIKGPCPLPFIGNFYESFFKSTLVIDLERKAKYGRIYGYFHGSTPELSVADPVLLKKILVKDFHKFTDRSKPPHHRTLKTTMFFLPGQEWKRIRNICSPSFTSLKLKNGLPLARKCLNSVIDVLSNVCSSNDRDNCEIDCKKLFGAYSLDVIARSAFATNIDTHKDPDNLFSKNLKGFFTVSFWRMFILLAFPKIAAYFDITFTAPDSMDFFEEVVGKIIEDRRKNSGHYTDLLQQLMDAEYDSQRTLEMLQQEKTAGNRPPTKRQDSQEMNASERKLTEFEIFCQSFIFLLAGYETTSNLLTHAVYSLAIYPEYQQRLFEEVEATLKHSELDYDTLHSMAYLEGVLFETLRLYSPLFRLDRLAVEDFYDEETGITIPKDTPITIPIHAIHRDAEFFPNPEKFSPDRFLPENKASLVPYTWLPFGAGPRNCIGMRFALLEAKLALAEIVKKYEFFPTDNTDVPLNHPTFQAVFSAKRVIVGIRERIK